MQESVMKAWWDSSHMAGANAAYVEEQYEMYLDNPQSVSDSWRQVFETLPKVDGVELETNHTAIRNQFRQLAALGPTARMSSSAGKDGAAPSDDRLSLIHI